ncbi:hypothetical protein B0H13DRAFT_441754 [Mycena leptocephala]|nr:hypothetical protein B0H13DRAFT_441754 [Mycena leptocephala]
MRVDMAPSMMGALSCRAEARCGARVRGHTGHVRHNCCCTVPGSAPETSAGFTRHGGLIGGLLSRWYGRRRYNIPRPDSALVYEHWCAISIAQEYNVRCSQGERQRDSSLPGTRIYARAPSQRGAGIGYRCTCCGCPGRDMDGRGCPCGPSIFTTLRAAVCSGGSCRQRARLRSSAYSAYGPRRRTCGVLDSSRTRKWVCVAARLRLRVQTVTRRRHVLNGTYMYTRRGGCRRRAGRDGCICLPSWLCNLKATLI